MPHDSSVRTRARRRRSSAAAALLLTGIVIIGAISSWSPASSSSTTGSPAAGRPRGLPAALGPADGAVPDGTTVFDSSVPGVAHLDAALLAALRRAARNAAGDGITFSVESGWRSAAYQDHLLEEAIGKYGSREEAARWVATPATSAHVTGDAIDLSADAAAWLAEHGARYGLCQTYGNEPWHFELRPRAADHGCPGVYADPTHDPRMHS